MSDARRPSAPQRGYTWSWHKLRAQKLKLQPLCEDCANKGRLRPAEEVHHVNPVRAGGAVLVAMEELRSLCRPCHRRHTAAEHGRIRGCDANGMPLDPRHPWNMEKKDGG